MHLTTFINFPYCRFSRCPQLAFLPFLVLDLNSSESISEKSCGGVRSRSTWPWRVQVFSRCIANCIGRDTSRASLLLFALWLSIFWHRRSLQKTAFLNARLHNPKGTNRKLGKRIDKNREKQQRSYRSYHDLPTQVYSWALKRDKIQTVSGLKDPKSLELLSPDDPKDTSCCWTDLWETRHIFDILWPSLGIRIDYCGTTR